MILLYMILGGGVGGFVGAAVDWWMYRPRLVDTSKYMKKVQAGPPKPLVLRLVVDTSKFDLALKKLQVALGDIGRTARVSARMFANLVRQPEFQLIFAQNRHGLGNRTEDGAWRSDMCSAWVCGSCPGLECDCRCHR